MGTSDCQGSGWVGVHGYIGSRVSLARSSEICIPASVTPRELLHKLPETRSNTFGKGGNTYIFLNLKLSHAIYCICRWRCVTIRDPSSYRHTSFPWNTKTPICEMHWRGDGWCMEEVSNLYNLPYIHTYMYNIYYTFALVACASHLRLSFSGTPRIPRICNPSPQQPHYSSFICVEYIVGREAW